MAKPRPQKNDAVMAHGIPAVVTKETSGHHGERVEVMTARGTSICAETDQVHKAVKP